MSLTIQHKSFGKWMVLDGELIVAEGLTKAEAQEMAGITPDAPVAPAAAALDEGDAIPLVDEQGKPLSDLARRRIYEKRLVAGLAQQADVMVAPFKALCFAIWPASVAQAKWQQMEPIVRSGADGVRREVGANRAAAIPAAPK